MIILFKKDIKFEAKGQINIDYKINHKKIIWFKNIVFF